MISNKKSIFIILRYLILLILVLSAPLIYKILTPITIYLTARLLDLFYAISVAGIQIMINQEKVVELTPACIAGSAYILLLILNLFVEMKPMQRVYSILISSGLLLILNILRIVILSILFVNDFKYFHLTHKFIWYALSTVLVIGVWFITIKILSIKQIPMVSDVKYIIGNIKNNPEPTIQKLD